MKKNYLLAMPCMKRPRGKGQSLATDHKQSHMVLIICSSSERRLKMIVDVK